jgi:hypothetical protein
MTDVNHEERSADETEADDSADVNDVEVIARALLHERQGRAAQLLREQADWLKLPGFDRGRARVALDAFPALLRGTPVGDTISTAIHLPQPGEEQKRRTIADELAKKLRY